MFCIYYNKDMSKKDVIEFRYYDMTPGEYVFALLGEGWIREYGVGVDGLHFHNYLEIGYCLDGNGYMTFCDEVKDYCKGTVTIIPKKFPHTTNSEPGTKSHWEYLFIDVDGFLHKVMTNNAMDIEKMINDINHGALCFDEKEYPDLTSNILEIMNIIRNQKEFHMDEAEGILKALLIKIARENALKNKNTYFEIPKNTDNKSSNTMFKILDYINEHYREDIKVRDIADACFMSETHLRRIFNSHMRIGILDFLNLVRIHKACEQLRSSNESVSNIASACGFSSLTTFNRNFMKFINQTPLTWRNSPENYEQKLLTSFVHLEEGWK